MGLPSQAPRSGATGRTFVRTHRKRRFRMGPLAIAGVVIVVGVGAGWWLTRGGGESPLGPDSAAAGDQVLDDPFQREVPTQPPVRIEQGSVGTAASSGGDAPGRAATPEAGRGGADAPAPEPLVLDTPRSLGESLAQVPTESVPTESPIRTPAGDAERGSGAFERAIRSAEQRLAADDPVAAREVLNGALRDREVTPAQRSQLRARLTELNERLIFSPHAVEGDPMTDVYEIARGDRLSLLPSKLGLAIDWRLIQRINGIPDADKIRLGQRVKVVSGPFHAVVRKGDYRLDVYAGPPDEPERWTYIRSFRVGLGEADSTPTGHFVVRRDSKLINPHWVNPRTGQRFDQDDPKNPIGEHWIGLDGIGEDAVKTGYGIHGTIEPESIGQQRSMGCVRLLDEDVALVYELLVEGISRVRIED
jgi:hypothetical protein